MANTIKTLGDGAITRKALSILHNKLVFVKSINKEYDSRFAVSGAKIGASLLIREPNQFTVRSGSVMETQDVTESTQTLTMATQRGVDINFSSVELTLSMDDFAKRILEPAMGRLAAEIDKIVIEASYKDVYNLVAKTTYGTVPTWAECAIVRAKLSKGLTPTGDRTMLMESLSMNSVANDVKGWFHSAPEISKAYDSGLMGHAMGFEFRETEMIPVHTSGTRSETGTCDTGTGAGFTSGTATITVASCGASTTFTQGDVFTIEHVYAVNPETKARYAHLQQWVVTADKTLDGSGDGDLAVSPTPIISGAKQNIDVAEDDSTAVVYTISETEGTGGVSEKEPQNLAYHKDAFTFVSADLEVPQGAGVFAARENFDGISLRVWRGNDIVNDKFPCRIDVLFGYKTIRPEWACRLIG